MGLRFQDPLWLLLLIPIIAGILLAIRRERRTAVLYSNVKLVESLPKSWALQLKRWMPSVLLAGMALLTVALARPQLGREEFRVRVNGIAIEMCIDRSGSMQAMDFQVDDQRVNRLDAVKKVFRDFVLGVGKLPERADDLIGLIAFGGYADAKCPLTLDHSALVEVLKSVKIPQPIYDSKGRMINERLLQEEMMTAVGDSVALAVERLKDVSAKSKVIVLLSDGESNAGVVSPADAAEAAKAYGIRIYTIGVGTTGHVPVPATDASGRKVLVPQLVRLDEATLKMLARETGGQYFHAQDTETLQNIYAEIDQLEKTPSEGRVYTEYRELYRYAMFPGLGLILLQFVLSCTRLRSLP